MISVQEDLFQEELGGLHSTEVAFALLTKIFFYCLVCGQKRDQTYLVLLQGILQMQLVANT